MKWVNPNTGPKSFDEEKTSAIEVGAKWKRGVLGSWIEFDPIPGWKEPLWGSDSQWLYLRRPEGVWRAKLEKLPSADGTFDLYIRHPKTNALLGEKTLFPKLANQGGWHRAGGNSAPVSASSRDQDQSTLLALPVNVDRAKTLVGDVLCYEPQRVVIQMGDSFAKPPIFSIENNWLIAEDIESGFREGYPLGQNTMADSALLEKKLWFSYGSRWMPEPFTVKVDPD